MNTTKFLILLLCLGLFWGITSTVEAQCPESVYNNYKFDEAQGMSATGISGASVTLTNTSWITGILNGGVSFNGTNGKGVLNDNIFNWTANQDFSIEFWFNLRSSKAANMVIVGRDDLSKQLHWWIGVNSNLRPSFTLRDNSGIISVLNSSSAIILNTWNHIAIVRENATNTNFMYINGQLTGSAQVDYTGDFSSTAPVTFGCMNYNGTDSYFTNTDMDEVVIHNSALSATEVLDHYTKQLNGTPICIVQNVQPIRILTLGNSITYDDRSNDSRPAGQRVGYRMFLYNKLKAAGYNIDFIGSEVAGQDLFPDPENGGFPGITKEQLVTLLQTGYNPRRSRQVTNGPYLDFYSPDVILLHVGTNSVSTDITAINQILSIIEDHRVKTGKNIKLIICRIINRGIYDFTTAQYNRNLEEAVKAVNNSNNIILDMEVGAGINYATEMFDNLHPNSLGYEKMASLWFSTLTGILDSPNTGFIKAPSTLNARVDGTNNVLTWNDNSTNEGGFRIERKTGSGTFEQVGQVAANVNTFSDANIQPLTYYVYRIYAFKDNTTSVYSNEATIQSHSGAYTNVALGKPVLQSSTAVSGVPERAIDNNTNGIFTNNSVSHTQSTASPYWQIDLKEKYDISKIEIWNRTDVCCISKLSDFYLFVSDVPFTSASLESTISQTGVWNTFYSTYPNPNVLTDVNRTGRYVRIQKSTEGSLTLAEVKIYGKSIVQQPTAPDAPSGLEAQATSPSIVTLSWADNSTDENGFRIERKAVSGVFTQIAELASNVTSYSDENLQPLTDYIYRVYAYNNVGSSTYTNEVLVKTLSPVTVINLAPGKPVLQSSTAYGGVPERANDNNTSGVWSQGSVSHTQTQATPYWEIDLQDVYEINNIEVWNRTDACCIDRLTDFYVFVSDVPFVSANLNTTLAQEGMWNFFNAAYPNPTLNVPVNRTGRYVRIQKSSTSVSMAMAEVKIFGKETGPAAPINLTAEASSFSKVTLTWTDNSTNETGFRVERKTGDGTFAQIAELTANSTGYVDEGLQELTNYTYRVYAFNATGNSTFSNEDLVQTPEEVTPTVPNAPGGLTAQATSSSVISLSWTDNSTNEIGFRVERKTVGGSFVQIAELASSITSFNNEGLQPLTEYSYRVYAFNNVGNSGYSNEISITTPTEVTNLAPGKPVFQSSTAYGGVPERANDNNTNGAWSQGSVSHTQNQATPYWQIDLQNVYNISKIEVWNRTDACCFNRLTDFYVLVSDVPFSSANLNTTLAQDGMWNYFNAAYPNPTLSVPVNRSGRYVRIQKSSLSSSLAMAEVKVFGHAITQEPTVPVAPSTLTAEATSHSTVSLQWADNSTNETGFRVERKTGNDAFTQVVELDPNTTSYNDIGLTQLTSYTYRVYAFNAVGNSAFSNESVVQTPEEVIPTAPAAPGNLTAETTSTLQVTLSWVDNASNETGFRIERKTEGGVFAQIAELAANSSTYNDEGLQQLTLYTYRVYAYNNVGNSGYSEEASVQTPATITNLAPGKPVMQSSTAYGGVAERANDNNTSGLWLDNSVSHTQNQVTPYWQIDLQNIYNINYIEVWNRTNSCCIDRLTDFYVFVSDEPFASANLNSTLTQSDMWNYFNAPYPTPNVSIPVNRTGRYVRVQKATESSLAMAEVKIFGTPINTATTKSYSTSSVTESVMLKTAPEIGAKIETTEVKVYPNPSSGVVYIEFDLPEEAKGSVSIVNMTGSEKKLFSEKVFSPGKHTFTWDGLRPDGGKVAPGIYVLRVVLNGELYIKKILITASE